MLTGILLGVIPSIIAALIYGVFFAGKESGIRLWLSRRGGTFSRKVYLALFIRSIRGYSHTDTTRNTLNTFILLAVVLTVSGCFLIDSFQKMTVTTRKSTQSTLQSAIDLLETQLRSLETLQGKDIPAKTPAPKELLAEQIGSLKKQLDELDISIARDQSETFNYAFWSTVRFSVACAISAYLIFVYGSACFLRQDMSFHLERLTLRLQSLASKSELAELTRLEAAVRDEQSARFYVHSMYRIAKRWGIESLCETFPFVNEVFFDKESPSPKPEAETEKD